MFCGDKMVQKVDFLTIFDEVVTLNFDLLTSKSNQFITWHFEDKSSPGDEIPERDVTYHLI